MSNNRNTAAAAPSLKASKKQAKAPSAPVVTKAAVVQEQPVTPPAQPAPAPAPTVVPVRGGLAIAAVKLTGKAYRVTAAHNVAWWKQVTDSIKGGDGKAAVTDIVKTGVPVTMVGYLVRRGYLAEAVEAAKA